MLVVSVSPDGGVQGLADAKADTDGDAHDEKHKEDLDDDAIPAAEVGHAGAAVLCLVCLGLLLPVVLAGPDLAVALPSEGTGRCLVLDARGVGRVSRDHGLDVGVEGVGAPVGARCGSVVGADGGICREGGLFGEGEGVDAGATRAGEFLVVRRHRDGCECECVLEGEVESLGRGIGDELNQDDFS